MYITVHVDVTVSLPAFVSVVEEDELMVSVCATLSAMEDTQRNITVTFLTSDSTGKMSKKLTTLIIKK